VARDPLLGQAARHVAFSGGAMRGWRVLLTLCLLWTMPRAVSARVAADSVRTAPRVAPVHSQLSFGVSIGREHDDNVLQLTRQNLDRFALLPGPPRFLIPHVGDEVTTALGTLRWRARLLRRRETRIELSAEAHRYDHDRAVDWQQYAWGVAQELTAARRSLMILELWGSRIPDYYLGEITDLDESVAAGGRIRRSLTYGQTSYGLRLRQDYLRGRFGLMGGLERVHRGYNLHFDERENTNEQWRLQMELKPFRRWDASVRVNVLRGDLNARGDLVDPLGVVDTDISYDHDGLGFAVTLPWGGRGAWKGRIDAAYMPELRTYTTTDKFDILRFGRENHRRDTRVRCTQRVWGPFDAITTWEKLTSEAEFHQGISFPAEQTNFAQEQFGVELRGRWDISFR
jgi:hypothetical protein